MLNLFKLPFNLKKRGDRKSGLSNGVAFNVLRNYIRRKKDLAPDDIDNAVESIEREIEGLKGDSYQSQEDTYEVMSKLLRRIDDELQKNP